MSFPLDPPDWTDGEVATEAKLDSISDAITDRDRPPLCEMWRTSDLSIPNTTNTEVTWQGAFQSSHGGWDAGEPTRYTAPVTGWYLVSAAIPWVLNTAAMKGELYFRVDGASEDNGSAVMKTTSNITITNSSTRFFRLDAGQYVEVVVWHSRGSSLAIDNSHHGGPYFQAHWISAG